MLTYLLVALGGAIGSIARYGLSVFAGQHLGATFPWGTFLVNVSGSFVIGFFFTLTGPEGRIFASGNTRQFVMTGLCGGFTTFSSFSLQTLELARDGEWLQAGANATGSVISCLIAVWLGHVAAVYLNQLKGA